jgi:hypothetical protein
MGTRKMKRKKKKKDTMIMLLFEVLGHVVYIWNLQNGFLFDGLLEYLKHNM